MLLEICKICKKDVRRLIDHVQCISTVGSEDIIELVDEPDKEITQKFKPLKRGSSQEE